MAFDKPTASFVTLVLLLCRYGCAAGQSQNFETESDYRFAIAFNSETKNGPEVRVLDPQIVGDRSTLSYSVRRNDLPSRLLRASTGKTLMKNRLDVMIDLQRIISVTGPKFVGVTIDASSLRHSFNRFDVNNKTAQNLAKGLAPSFVRVGGSAADFLIFRSTAGPVGGGMKPSEKNFTLTANEWERLNYLVSVAGWDLIFDFNEFLRSDGHWDISNARQLLQFSQQQNYSISHFQLGNEPDAYEHDFHFDIPGSLLTSDMKMLRSLLSEFPLYKNSSIVGPDVTKVTKDVAKEYLEEFLRSGGQNVVAAATLHHYYFNAEQEGVKLADFYNTSVLDMLIPELSIGTSVVRSQAPHLPVWLSETSSISGGGLLGASNGYVAGFMWLDKLGLSALFGIEAVLRQSFAHGNYALISDSDYFPRPDYFLTVLYKRLVQGPVFNVTTSTENVRVYASCANSASYGKGALTVYALNILAEATDLNLVQFADQKYDVYLLTPGDEGGLKSPYVALNGQKLVLVNGDLPLLSPTVKTGPITFPAYSFGFIVLPHAGVKACM